MDDPVDDQQEPDQPPRPAKDAPTRVGAARTAPDQGSSGASFTTKAVVVLAVIAALFAGILIGSAGNTGTDTTIDTELAAQYPASSATVKEALDKLSQSSTEVSATFVFGTIDDLVNAPPVTFATPEDEQAAVVDTTPQYLETGVVDFATRSAVTEPEEDQYGPAVVMVDGQVYYDWENAAALDWADSLDVTVHAGWVSAPREVARSGIDVMSTTIPTLVEFVDDHDTWLTEHASEPQQATGPQGQDWTEVHVPLDSAALADNAKKAVADLDDDLAAWIEQEYRDRARLVPDGIAAIFLDSDGNVGRIALQLAAGPDPLSADGAEGTLTIAWDIGNYGVDVAAEAPEGAVSYLEHTQQLAAMLDILEEQTIEGSGGVETIGDHDLDGPVEPLPDDALPTEPIPPISPEDITGIVGDPVPPELMPVDPTR